MKSSIASVSALVGMPADKVKSVLVEHEQYEASAVLPLSNPFARVLHGWHNDKDYVGPYGFPIDLPFEDGLINFTALSDRHARGVSPEIILQELQRIDAVTEVGNNVWKPLKQEYIEPKLSPENLRRMANLVESLLSTLEHNTSGTNAGDELFERTLSVDEPLTERQFVEFQKYIKIFGAQFLHRVDKYAAVDINEKMGILPGEVADIDAGLQCFLFVKPPIDETRLRDAIDFGASEK